MELYLWWLSIDWYGRLLVFAALAAVVVVVGLLWPRKGGQP